MVLSKRNANGEFVIWSSSQGSASTNTPAPVAPLKSESPPPAKKARYDPPVHARTSHSIHYSSSPAQFSKTSAPIVTPSYVPAPSLSAPPVASYPATSSQPSVSAPPKRTRKRKADDAGPPPEKRGARFKPNCPQNILDRVERVMIQRIFMIDRTRVEGELKEQFSVLGSTGNVYIVAIDHKPRCTCPDHIKGNHCKHILSIFLKVLQVTQASGYWYQKALLTTELEEIFAQAPLAPNSLAHPHIREAYARATGKAPSNGIATPVASNKRVPGPDGDCPICYDGMRGVAEAALVYCEQCGNALHKECFGQWQRTAASSGKDLTCVWCRARWVLAPAAGGAGRAAGARRGQDGYLNLAGVAGVSPVRDTSTYYHGPMRGRRYLGYQDYGL